MDDITERKLTNKERKIIEKIEEGAKKRPHKRQYSVKFIIEHISDHGTMKGWDYDCKQDLIDMLDSIGEIAVKMGVWTEKAAKEEKKYYLKEWGGWFDEED